MISTHTLHIADVLRLRGGTKAERLANQLLNQTPVELIAALQVLNAKAGRNEETLR